MSPVQVKFPRESTLWGDLVIHQVLEWFSEVNREMYWECNASDMRKIFWFVARICHWNAQKQQV